MQLFFFFVSTRMLHSTCASFSPPFHHKKTSLTFCTIRTPTQQSTTATLLLLLLHAHASFNLRFFLSTVSPQNSKLMLLYFSLSRVPSSAL
jgi:hypothetical protein